MVRESAWDQGLIQGRKTGVLISPALPESDDAVICLLDDDPSVLKGLGRLLSSEGWTARQFLEPLPFLDYTEMHRTPVAIIDICMPAMSGLEVQSRLRSVSPSTRVIVLTGREDPLVQATALKGGASAFFLKPYDDDELLVAVRMALSALD